MIKWPWHKDRTKGSSGLKQSGNILFVLFGAAAVAGVVGVSANMLMKGPVKSMSQMSQSTITKTQMETASRMLMLDAANLAAADCDGDRLIEAREWKNAAGAGPDGVAGSNGGGFIPDAVGAAKRDTWGTQYGYCVWDHGAVIDSTACGGATQKRLQGTNSTAYPVIAIISAGKNKTFETPCRDFSVADVNANGKLGDVGDLPLVTPAGDDMVTIYSYAEANQENPHLWSLGMDADGNVVAQMDGAVKTVTFSGDTASFGGTFKLTGAKGLVIPTQAAVPNCNISTEGQIRRNTLANPVTIQFCKLTAGVYAWEDAGMGQGSGGGGSGTALTEKETGPASGDFRAVHVLKPNDEQASSVFGTAIAMDHRYAVIGRFTGDSGFGAAYVIDYITGRQISKLTPTDHSASNYSRDRSVAIRGNYALIGASGKNTDQGAAYLFNATTGVQIRKFVSPLAGAGRFGRSVALSDRYAYVGADANTTAHPTGAIFVFDIATGALVNTIFPPTTNTDVTAARTFGFTMDISGDVLVVGAPYTAVKNGGGVNQANAGAVYVLNAQTGQEISTLIAPTRAVNNIFGWNVAISEKYVVVSMVDAPTGSSTGFVYVYDVTNGSLVRTLSEADNAASTNWGIDVDISGDYVIVGADRADVPSTDAGATYIYSIATGAETAIRPGPNNASDQNGAAVAMFGNYALSGDIQDDCTAGFSCGAVNVLVAGSHNPARVNVTQTTNGNNTIGNLGWVNTVTSDVIGMQAGIGFGIGPVVSDSMPATAAITAYREANPNSSGLAFKFNDGSNQLVNGMYLGTNGRLRLAPDLGTSAQIHAFFQIGMHSNTLWNTGYANGLLVTSKVGTDMPVYFGYQNDTAITETGTVALFPKSLEIGRFDINRPQSVTPVLAMDSAATLYGNIEQYSAASSAQRIAAYNSTAANDARIIFSKRRGGAGAPELPASGDTIGSILFRGYDGAAYPGPAQAQIKAVVNGVPATGNVPLDLVFGLSPTGDSDGNEAMRITSAGLIGINKVIPEAMLHVGGRIVASTTLRIGNDTICGTALDTNTIRHTGSGVFEYCNGSGWFPLATAANSVINTSCSPDPFDFTDRAGLVNNAYTSTNTVILSGMSGRCYMTVSRNRNEVIVLNGTEQGTLKMVSVQNGDAVMIRANAPNGSDVPITMYVSIGDKTDAFTYARASTCTTTIGTVCADGTVYAGINTQDVAYTFVTRCDFGMSWTGATCAGTRGLLPWNDGTVNYTDTSRPNLTNGNISGDHENSFRGSGNTTLIYPVDASTATGFQMHAAVSYCYNLVENGYSDWYLPSIQELKVMDTNSTAIAYFSTVSGSHYWSSNENEASESWTQNFSSAHARAETTKQTPAFVRCMRKVNQ